MASAVRSKYQPSLLEEAVIVQRVRPFVDDTRPLILLLSEAYVQGIRDAVEIQEADRG